VTFARNNRAGRAAHLARTREAVRRRASGRCEFPGCIEVGVHLAHGFGRGHIISVPLCDEPEFCWWACYDHHALYDRRRRLRTAMEDPLLADLRREVAQRAATRWDVDPGDMEPIDVAREIERRWRETQA
jgi:hypothetical protein